MRAPEEQDSRRTEDVPTHRRHGRRTRVVHADPAVPRRACACARAGLRLRERKRQPRLWRRRLSLIRVRIRVGVSVSVGAHSRYAVV